MENIKMIDVLNAAIAQVQKTHPIKSDCYIGIADAMKLFNEITSVHKWYHKGKIDRHHASRIVKQHKAGTYRNYEWFFKRFGYETIHVMMPIEK